MTIARGRGDSFGDWRDTAEHDYCPKCGGEGEGPRKKFKLPLEQYVLPDGASVTGCWRCGWKIP